MILGATTTYHRLHNGSPSHSPGMPYASHRLSRMVGELECGVLT